MKFGAGFSLKALADAAEIRDFAQTPEGAGFDFTSIADYTIGQSAGTYPGRAAPWTFP